MGDNYELKEVVTIKNEAKPIKQDIALTEKQEKSARNNGKDTQIKKTTNHNTVIAQNVLDSDSIENPDVSVTVSNQKIISGQLTDTRGYGAPNPNERNFPQTPYYQQNVSGQAVYVEGPEPPQNAARMQAYRPGRAGRGSDNSGDFRNFRDSSIFGSSFDEVKVRNRFVQRVYTILTFQLVYTCGFIALCIFEPNVKWFVQRNIMLLYVAMGIELVVYFAMICVDAARRNFPTNFFLLALFTVAFAYIMGVISTLYSTYIVMTSIGITAAVSLLVSIFACQTSIDITTCGVYLCIVSIVVAIFGIIAVILMFVIGSTIAFLVYAGIIAVLFSLYLMYDTQMIMGGRRIELSPEEYIFGAIHLYIDIMYIFWAILTLLGMSRS